MHPTGARPDSALRREAAVLLDPDVQDDMARAASALQRTNATIAEAERAFIAIAAFILNSPHPHS
jgi:hypothetical protein